MWWNVALGFHFLCQMFQCWEEEENLVMFLCKLLHKGGGRGEQDRAINSHKVINPKLWKPREGRKTPLPGYCWFPRCFVNLGRKRKEVPTSLSHFYCKHCPVHLALWQDARVGPSLIAHLDTLWSFARKYLFYNRQRCHPKTTSSPRKASYW